MGTYHVVNDQEVEKDPTNRVEYRGIAPDPRALVAGSREALEGKVPSIPPDEVVYGGTQGTTGLAPNWPPPSGVLQSAGGSSVPVDSFRRSIKKREPRLRRYEKRRTQ